MRRICRILLVGSLSVSLGATHVSAAAYRPDDDAPQMKGRGVLEVIDRDKYGRVRSSSPEVPAAIYQPIDGFEAYIGACTLQLRSKPSVRFVQSGNQRLRVFVSAVSAAIDRDDQRSERCNAFIGGAITLTYFDETNSYYLEFANNRPGKSRRFSATLSAPIPTSPPATAGYGADPFGDDDYRPSSSSQTYSPPRSNYTTDSRSSSQSESTGGDNSSTFRDLATMGIIGLGFWALSQTHSSRCRNNNGTRLDCL